MRELVQEATIVVHLFQFLVLLVHIGERTVPLQPVAFGLVERDAELPDAGSRPAKAPSSAVAAL